MFSLQPNDELVFGATNPSKGCEIPQDLMTDDALTQTNYINFCTGSSEGRVMSPTKNSAGLTRPSDERESNIRRVLHRDIERKRRREMSNLHLTLSSLLPNELKKGKSGVCDQMQEAASYIKSLQNKIEELRIRRDKLSNSSQNKLVSGDDDEFVTINLVPDGIEVLIKTVYYGVSRALEVLSEEREIDVVNCVSTRLTNAKFLHKIHIQARDLKSLDVSVLQDKLRNSMK